MLSVIDSGVGIKKEDRVKLFKLFGKVSSTRNMNTGGIGLGLVISEQIVKCFDGTAATSVVGYSAGGVSLTTLDAKELKVPCPLPA